MGGTLDEVSRIEVELEQTREHHLQMNCKDKSNIYFKATIVLSRNDTVLIFNITQANERHYGLSFWSENDQPKNQPNSVKRCARAIS